VKKRGLILLIFLSVSIGIVAQERDKKVEHGCLSVKTASETVKYNFDSFKDLEENLDATLTEMETNLTENTPLTIEIQINLINSDTSITFTASAIGPRSTIPATVKKLCLSLLKGVSE
jgi:hypothetical protein